ncbi:transcriptional regulator, AraC family [Chitinophaga sp. YR627]|uniref:helix-turn-helix domain-containing protein n=1 Tax=Chitinophaga sp. YR627 TaxID=1881041 RepID=UPI0008EA7670|nr:AraC family transcriptional regulator [Chitinophaga sp. YR627]SFM77954.1 transcriptional regulator, AraC family [Chitinophaga sp. YR627]
MNVINLPQDLNPAQYRAEDRILIRPYTSPCNTKKNRVILHRNMINLLIEGRKTVIYGGQTTTVNDNAILFLAAGSCLTTNVKSDNGNFQSVLLYFSDDALLDFYMKYARLVQAQQRDKQLPAASFITFEKDVFLRNYIDSLRHLLQLDQPLPQEICILKFEELLLYLLQTAPETLLQLKANATGSMQDFEIRKAVEGNITRPVTVEELAFLCSMSLSTFKRRFMKIYGTSPQRWLLEQKMQVAARLLLDQQVKPGDVYDQVGYESHSSFTKAFRQVFGMTPSAYQEQNMNVQA